MLVLVAPAGTDREGLALELAQRGEFELRFAARAREAERALGERRVALLVAAPEVTTADVNRILSARRRLRPELPILVVRDRQAEEPAGWAGLGVGVLRRPLLPMALRRSVDVVLGLTGRLGGNPASD